MPTYSFVQCDVFTDRIFEGNPLAVFPEAAGIDDVTMQRIAREMNLSETVFVLPPTDATKALRRLRIFTPGQELPLAGHPVVGTWNMLARQGIVAAPASGTGRVMIQHELKLGVLPVAIDFADGVPTRVVMTQGAPQVGEPLDEAAACARALNLSPDDIGDAQLPIVVSSTGVKFLIVPLRSRSALSRMKTNGAELSALLGRTGGTGLYAVTRETHRAESLVSTRMFADESTGIGEDPATGSAAGTLAAALVHYGVARPVNGVANFIIEQGIDMGRPSRIEAEVEGAAGAVRVVRIGGAAVEVLKGELTF
ncbi:MAG TPA: PhzF family phenazine biosynthesis protein [Blastocatellia bacterium]|nr:PhzF family phenazine biosynthesis protein [Blastocatellia bacterium]